ncbi:hypothetical protein LCGC14_1181490 [marine sediment metagenome]|uniref:Tail tubular protein A n=1 Tax=marine sediment metagenome TaxID=412755 RepID=A0A0F9LM32_9ZZZZ
MAIETKINPNQEAMSGLKATSLADSAVDLHLTPIDMVNNALLLLGAAPITSFEDTGDTVTLVKTRYSFLRDSILTSYPWSFAKKRAQLTELLDEGGTTVTPLFDFSRAYELPPDCLRVLDTDLGATAWKKEGRYIVTDSTSAAILYIARIVDVNMWPPDFQEAFAAQLAADISYSLTKKLDLQQQMFDLANLRMSEAKANDGQEGTQDQITNTSLIDVR